MISYSTLIRNLIYVILCSWLLTTCRKPQAEPQTPVTPIITGTVSIPVRPDSKLPTVDFPANIQNLYRSKDQALFRMVAYGGSLMAGYRDGGLFRQGQLTCIPELVAHQMGLTTFQSPLFSVQEGNGTGYLTYDKMETLPSWKRVINQLGVVQQSPYALSKYQGRVPDNIGLPEGVITDAADSEQRSYKYPDQIKYYAYLNRLFSADMEGSYSASHFLDVLPTDLILYERDLDLWIGIAMYPERAYEKADRALGGGVWYYIYRDFIVDNTNKGRKLVLFNQPDYLDCPFFHLYKVGQLKQLGPANGVTLEDSALLIPTDNVKGAFQANRQVPATILDKDILSVNEINILRRITTINNKNNVEVYAKQYNLPMVDLYALYKKISNRQYITADGLFIDPSFPDGNFFSSDGVHPSAIGNAVIANEVIHAINNVYRTQIPLINVSRFKKSLL